MKARLLKNLSNTEAGEIIDVIMNYKHKSPYGYFFEGSLLVAVYPTELDFIKDEPEVKQVEPIKFDNYEKNIVDLIRNLSSVVSEIKFK